VIPNSQVRQVLLLLFIAILFGLIFWNLHLFIPSLLGAYTLYVLLRIPVKYLTEERGWNVKLATGLLMLTSFCVILIPINILIRQAGSKLVEGFRDPQLVFNNAQTLISNLEGRMGMQLATPERIKALTEWGVQELGGALNATLTGLLLLLVAYFILWFMLTEGKKMETSFFEWLPLKPANIEYVRKELNDLVYSNAIGIPLMGVIQGTFGLIGYSLAGVEDVWFWVLLTFITGMIPFLGVALAFVPLSFVLLAKGQTGSAAFVFAYGFVVIGSVDNLARMWLLKKIGNTHPLITLFGVIIGLQLFGFIGFIFGPIMIAMFLLLLKIYAKEFR
jgi:predicted PurR-regulated permease PerM